MNGLASAFLAILRRDLVLAFRHRGELANPLLFFLIIVTLYPLGVSPDPELLRRIAPGVIWIAALLAALFSLENLFRSDFDDGSLEQMLLSPRSLALLVIAKVLAHWLVSGLPMLLLAPLLALLLDMPSRAAWTLETTLAIGTPLLSLIGAIGVALTVGLKRGGILLTLLILPLYIPVLIFATNAVAAAGAGMPVEGQLYFLAALLALALTLAPVAIAAALRISMS
ncbi:MULTISPECIES: heme exporter protein CcmB [Methylococcus]|jgi:heme exporter protein B|uniref:Heme exporter protein B n=1 Tax=Methylococcus capsulatus (strain ATCC 33009 / NCIMB 11132 / Bath) TaxID=243233 RepID=Q60AB4_METCA|nr:heme exporter protein CcmB [Methylococcus capsulatus]AAU92748.1 heme exporter protein CcmB [Methylococcus capsulatus str. Bath]QXP88299.1 heme exporter protein CcmB [Methylococcus capsulatus]QXP90347.1 heme exporter protein CcmB [Methylococcus capsulatus]QXP94693.1 heme exporter protein CcmB [Methylococcus capsulatus]UQN13337.1 heme exporter protein CcmB [Methylococcus capsulatus]